MYACLGILLFLINVVHQLKIKTSYTTSYQCHDEKYALVRGANLTLIYDYGFTYEELESFHLYETIHVRHMFDYESAAGQAFLKDKENRLKSYEWTKTGIKFVIPGISKEKDLGKYKGDVAKGPDDSQKTIEVQEIYDPPTEVKITTPSGVDKKVILKKGFKEYVFEASAESYTGINCNSVTITWVSSTSGTIETCQAKDVRDATVCPLTLKESEMTQNVCMRLEVYAEQYGVQSEKKSYEVCYYDPATKVKITLPSGAGAQLNLKEGFGEYVFEALAEPFTAIDYNSFNITWVSSKTGDVKTCQAKDERDATVCPLTLNESDMTPGDCVTLEVYAKQYDVESEKKAYDVCYKACGSNKAMIVGVVMAVIIVIIVITVAAAAVYLKRKGQMPGGNTEYIIVSNTDTGKTQENIGEKTKKCNGGTVKETADL